jgi:hypothetical protein
MYSPDMILAWITQYVHPMRLSRQKTLADIVAAAMQMRGSGVLALGRALSRETAAKHSIKRVWRFFRNKGVEISAIRAALISVLAPRIGPIVVLVDWTDLGPYKLLVASFPRDGRALPVWWKTIRKDAGEGSMIAVEREFFEALAEHLPAQRVVVVIADRGFGNTRWIGDCIKRGWGYVQRLAGNIVVDGNEYLGKLSELGIQPGSAPRDWGPITMTDENPLRTRLVTTFSKDTAKEPWCLVTDQEGVAPHIVRLYARRMWIEEMFRDLKNRRWGLGLDHVELSEPERHDRHFAALALTYLFLCAFGAAAETENVADQLKANTETTRAMSLARIGNYFIQVACISVSVAIEHLNRLPP